ncbi:hypothetical protein, partial [Thiolapillus sp.]
PCLVDSIRASLTGPITLLFELKDASPVRDKSNSRQYYRGYLYIMKAKDLKNTRRFKKLAPTLVAGATIFGVTGAAAGFKNVIVHDQDNYMLCDIKSLEHSDPYGIQVVMEPNESCYQYLRENQVKDKLKFVYQVDGTPKAGCTLNRIELNNKGEMTIQVKEGCFYTEGEYVARV